MGVEHRDIMIRVVVRSFSLIPLFLRKAFFIGLWRLFYHASQRHRFIAFYNLKRAFPDKSMAEIVRIAQGAYRNLAIVCAEFFDLSKMNKSRLNALLDTEGLERAQQALGKKKGLLFFSAHFGNWELMAVAVAVLIAPGVAVYRPLDNPWLERLVRYVRAVTGNIPVPKQRAMLQMFRCLARNGTVGVLIDQNVSWKEGVFVDFFGRPACTTDGLAQMALKLETPVMPAFMVRKPDGRYRLIIGEEVNIIRTEDWDADVRSNTQMFTGMIEEMIRQYPDQWLWLHQRWKTKMYQGIR
ncbi:MAG TPA: lysophospholipid acyltransferase family protein [Syntrophales bacterium]|nr:lysophospholipid acyltransferase family protein [Syntrophales bacterium]